MSVWLSISIVWNYSIICQFAVGLRHGASWIFCWGGQHDLATWLQLLDRCKLGYLRSTKSWHGVPWGATMYSKQHQTINHQPIKPSTINPSNHQPSTINPPNVEMWTPSFLASQWANFVRLGSQKRSQRDGSANVPLLILNLLEDVGTWMYFTSVKNHQKYPKWISSPRLKDFVGRMGLIWGEARHWQMALSVFQDMRFDKHDDKLALDSAACHVEPFGWTKWRFCCWTWSLFMFDHQRVVGHSTSHLCHNVMAVIHRKIYSTNLYKQSSLHHWSSFCLINCLTKKNCLKNSSELVVWKRNTSPKFIRTCDVFSKNRPFFPTQNRFFLSAHQVLSCLTSCVAWRHALELLAASRDVDAGHRWLVLFGCQQQHRATQEGEVKTEGRQIFLLQFFGVHMISQYFTYEHFYEPWVIWIDLSLILIQIHISYI